MKIAVRRLLVPLLLAPFLPACGEGPESGDEPNSMDAGAPADGDGPATGSPGAAGGSGTDPNSPNDPDSPNDPNSPDDPSSPGDTPSTDPTTSMPSPGLGEDTGPGAVPEGVNPGGAALDCTATDPGESPLLKLSTLQYRNTVSDLLSAANMEAVLPAVEASLASIPDDSLGDSFRTLDARVSIQHVQGYLDVGIAVGDALIADSESLEAAAGPCALEDTMTEACATEFLTGFLQLVYRRPVDSDDLTPYLDLIDGRTGPEAVRAMVVVALSSPRFVNHVEIDGTAFSNGSDLLQLTAYEVASRLSYTFWQTMPDAELLDAAADGSLVTEAGFEAQLARVFESPRTRQTLWRFWDEWLKLEKFTGFETSRPAFISLAEGTGALEDPSGLYGAMVQEVRDISTLLTFDQQGTVTDLLTTTVSVTQSTELAALYGSEPYSGAGAYPELPEGTRAGLFQRAALLVSNLEQTNPFHRGALVRRALLCDALPQPDPNALPPGSLDPPPLDVAQTTRERFEAKVAGNGLCETCHGSFSDIGYVLESFDALGRARTTERVYDEQTGELLAELPIDTTAVARIESADDTPVANAAELADRILASGKVEACVAQNYFRFATRREAVSASLDACVVDDLRAMLADPEQGLAAAFRRVAQYDSFFQRKVGER